MRKIWVLTLLLLTWATTICGAQKRYDAEAVRLNNRGVAQMGQQFTERAADQFAEAFKKDPKLAQAAINEGIALLTLQKVDEARRLCGRPLRSIRPARRPGTTWAWRNMPATNWSRAGQLSAGGKDRSARCGLLLFRGACYQEMKQFDKAIAIFKQALAVNPLHASAEFGLARALQRTGHTAEARSTSSASSI